jgi:hypothetical protein
MHKYRRGDENRCPKSSKNIQSIIFSFECNMDHGILIENCSLSANATESKEKEQNDD